VGYNAFELNIPPFLGLHLVFNVDLLRPYFPPLLDTSEIANQLTPIELKPEFMEHASIYHIVDIQFKGTHQQNLMLYRVVKAGQLLTKASGSPRAKLNKNFPIWWGKSRQWRPFLPKEGGLIQVDIDGHPPLPIGSQSIFILEIVF
jgi:hypothetical protein